MKNLDRSLRPDLGLIAGLVRRKSHVLDLGCGNGELLAYLRDNLGVDGFGVEISPAMLLECIGRNLPVYRGDIEEGLAIMGPKSFDLAILSQTLQQMARPREVVRRLIETAERAIVSFPNFGALGVRLDLLVNGRMPKNRAIPYEWHSTPNIHHLTVKDFRKLCREENIRILGEHYLGGPLKDVFPNLFARLAVFVIGKDDTRQAPRA